MKICGFGYYDAETLAKKANKYNKLVEKSENRFNILKSQDKEQFNLYILNSIRKLSSIGCTSFEYQTDTNLKSEHKEFFKRLDDLGFKYKFYKLDKRLCDKKYNLLIDWMR